MMPSMVVSLLQSGDWGPIDIGESTDALDWLRRPNAVKWLDAQFPIRAKQSWGKSHVVHIDPASSGHQFCLSNCTTPGLSYQRYLRHDPPRIAMLRARLRLQRAHTNQYRVKFRLPQPNLVAELCEHPPCLTSGIMETIEHVLLHCPRYQLARQVLVRTIRNIYTWPSAVVFLPLTVPFVLGAFAVQLAPALSSQLLTASGDFLFAIRLQRFL